MKALSIKQPWAGLIIEGIKTVENRSWYTWYRGQMAVCATQSPNKEALTRMQKKLGSLPEICKVNGSILGIVDLAGIAHLAEDGVVETDHPKLDLDVINDWWDDTQVAFILESPRKLSAPIPFKGRLGLYQLDPKIIAKINRDLNKQK